MSPPRDHHDLHLVPREEPDSAPPNVARLPPRPVTPVTLPRVADKLDALQLDSRESIFIARRIETRVGTCEEAIGRCELAIMAEILPWQARAGMKLEAIQSTLDGIADVVGKAPDLAALAHASHTDLTPEHIARLDSEAKFGTGIHKRLSELSIQLGRIDRRALVGAGIGAAITTHGPDLVVAAASLGWPGVALLALVVAALALTAYVRRKAAK